jgi:Phosphate-selective porin O and P
MIRYISQSQPVSLLLALLLWHGSAHAQAEGHSSQPIISFQIEELRAEVQQLRQLVEQQQRALMATQKRADEGEVTSPAGAARSVPPANAHADSGTAAPRQAAASASNAAETPDQASPLAGWNGNRFFMRSSDGRFQSDIIGYSQLDFHGYQSGNHPPNTFLIRRARLGVEGRLERYFDYKVEGDFADTNSTLLRDLYGRIHRTDAFQLSFGQFRVPISQEEMRFDAVQDFVERSMVNSLVPSRSPGLMASGVLAKRVFEYQIGAFNGKGLLATNNNGTPESALRVRLSPWKNRKSAWGNGFSFGGAFTTGRNVGGLSVGARPKAAVSSSSCRKQSMANRPAPTASLPGCSVPRQFEPSTIRPIRSADTWVRTEPTCPASSPRATWRR